MIDFKGELKYYYRRIVSESYGVSNVDYVRFDSSGPRYFSDDFPALYGYMLCSQSILIRHHNGISLHIYRDKYKNIVVRYYETTRKVRV